MKDNNFQITQQLFYIDDQMSYINWKINVNFSKETFQILKEDVKNFTPIGKRESFDGLLNSIFRNYFENAEASINKRYIREKERLHNLYFSNNDKYVKIDFKLRETFIETQSKNYAFELFYKVNQYVLKNKGIQHKFRPDNKTKEIFKSLITEAGYYDSSIGKYLKAIFEEYAKKPNYEREIIYFYNNYRIINEAINDQKVLKITSTTKIAKNGYIYKNKYYFKPYKIIQNKFKLFNYLIGYSKIIRYQTDGNGITEEVISEDENPAVLRLSFIESATELTSMGAHISKEMKDKLEELIYKNDVMFITDEIKKIKVLFSDKGISLFRSQLYMRPQHYTQDIDNKYLYTFECTEKQAEYYFFKMGWDAIILEPQDLRDLFIRKYSRALKIYQGYTRDDIKMNKNN